MGIKYAHKYTHTIKSLTIDNLFTIASQLLKKKNSDAVCLRSSPTIDVDCSWVVRGFFKGDNDSRVRQLINFSIYLAQVGFHVNLVCDGAIRHHSKRATIQRQSEAQKNVYNS
jgi:hypothetical protein